MFQLQQKETPEGVCRYQLNVDLNVELVLNDALLGKATCNVCLPKRRKLSSDARARMSQLEELRAENEQLRRAHGILAGQHAQQAAEIARLVMEVSTLKQQSEPEKISGKRARVSTSEPARNSLSAGTPVHWLDLTMQAANQNKVVSLCMYAFHMNRMAAWP